MGTQLKLGCIADDFTGATDLANNLVRAGMRVVQTIGVPAQPVEGVDAVVVALKSRTIEPAQAVAQSLAALHWLREQGCTQVYFKVCSTFDSTPRGNIGPVAQALAGELEANFVCITPAFPENARTVYKGQLFVGDVPLSESGMRNHPLTPMTDSNLVRVMQAQSRDKVGLVAHDVVRRGADAIRERIAQLQSQGVRFGIVDAITNDDLVMLGRALSDAPLVVAGSGVAIGLPQNHGIEPSDRAAELPLAQGYAAVISGSCSVATNAQVAEFKNRGLSAFVVDPMRIAAGDDLARQALEWAKPRLGKVPVLVYATASPEDVKSVQASLGAQAAGDMVERTLAAIAKGLVQLGAHRLVIAGGETSGAVVSALGVEQMRIGMQIDPGVPWCFARATACDADVHLALKSGNFGGADFFIKAFEVLA
ncbi:MAG TPA: 3-oxo-tetronate kinase [Ramlibacter sp.]|nr:3-oxo-tetronate kinase [Ramlibacter sp.]